ncbi:uncharacterized protein [Amphiura filiformis]|uniref:uncharacterized protein n=1 Tax=Amphiura filiformis TaxID=82378 RepID=UPI003B224509
MALVRWFGKPELFITFTCNPRWPEIADRLQQGQSATDRQDIVNRVFNLKLKQFFKDLFSSDVLGNIKAYCWTLEEQKRSLKHVHLLAIRQQPLTPEWVDDTLWAFIPDPNTMPKLHQIVTQSMLHGPCGTFNPNFPCMINRRCKANYPKDFRSNTEFSLYARPNDGTFHEKNGFRFDNRWVVPYNPWLLLKYNAHINTEVGGSVKNVKYLYKYITKGADMASVGIEDADQENTDEITNYISSRWITASTATWNMFEFPTHGRHPPIVRLAVHE